MVIIVPFRAGQSAWGGSRAMLLGTAVRRADRPHNSRGWGTPPLATRATPKIEYQHICTCVCVLATVVTSCSRQGRQRQQPLPPTHTHPRHATTTTCISSDAGGAQASKTVHATTQHAAGRNSNGVQPRTWPPGYRRACKRTPPPMLPRTKPGQGSAWTCTPPPPPARVERLASTHTHFGTASTEPGFADPLPSRTLHPNKH